MQGARFLLTSGILTACLLGCGESGPKVGTVTGTVKLDGDPVEGAFVTFMPLFSDGTECQSAEKTDASGAFEMQYSIDKKGVLLGEHQVTISTKDFEKQPDGSNKTIPEEIPKWYYGPDSVLRFTVEEGENVADFDLTKKRPKN